jgi:hypothetical protein
MVAESKGQFPSAFREPGQCNGRSGCGNECVEVEVVQQRMSELIANSFSGDQDVVKRPGLPEVIAESARSSADLEAARAVSIKRLGCFCGKAPKSAHPVQGRPR